MNGCSGKTDSNTTDNVYARRGSNQGIVNAVSYNDGVYVGEGELKSHGKEVATITISSGRISEVVFQRLDSNGKELISRTSNNVQIDRTQKALLEDDTNLNINYLILDVMRKQSYDISIPTKDKDLLLNWKLAVKNALEKAKK
jgi:hypothetical protein